MAPTRWVRVPLVKCRTLAILNPDGAVELLWDGIGSREAAKLLGCSIRHVQAMCDEGKLKEGLEWRHLRGTGKRHHYRINREALLKLQSEAKG